MTRKYKTRDYFTKIKNKSVVDKTTGCWIWTGKSLHRQGYPFARHGGHMRTVIRALALELKLFPIDKNSRITNTCENILCVNPEHIMCCTHTDIMYRRYDRYGTKGQFNNEQALDFYKEYRDMKKEKIPRTINILAEKYNCSPSVLYRTIDRAKKGGATDVLLSMSEK